MYYIAPSSPPLSSIMSEHPQAVCGLAFDLVQRLSPIVRQIDFALDWMELEAGRALYKCVGRFQLIIVGYTPLSERLSTMKDEYSHTSLMPHVGSFPGP